MGQASEPRGDAPIRFGTSGWRGILGDDFTFPRLRVVLAAVGRWLAEAPGAAGEVIVAHDTRFLGERMARLAAEALCAQGQRPLLAKGAVPTPVVARAIRRRRARAALVFTASHNPPEYQGLKLLDASGGSLGLDETSRIESLLGAPGEPAAAPSRRVRSLDLAAPYRRDLLAVVDRAPIARARLQVVYDAMHGAGAPVLTSALAGLGARVRLLRGEPDPRFGGVSPDPIPERLRDLSRVVRAARGRRLGLATDGDADRFAAVDRDGRVLSATQSAALLVDHLARSGRIRRGVALSIATGSLVEKVAQAHGLAVTRHPIGFRFLSRELVRGGADAAADESGGFALGSFSADKDGILSGCLLAELMATLRDSLGERLAELERRHGRSDCGRSVHALRPRALAALARLRGAPPARVGEHRVRAETGGDGLRLVFDDGFLFLRASGTEPVLRIYAEARSPRALARRLAAGARLLAT
jgi:phosphomannomutase